MKFLQRKQTADERIGFLANELIKELKKSGRSIAHRHINEGFGSLSIIVHRLGSKNTDMRIESNGWEVYIQPTFSEF